MFSIFEIFEILPPYAILLLFILLGITGVILYLLLSKSPRIERFCNALFGKQTPNPEDIMDDVEDGIEKLARKKKEIEKNIKSSRQKVNNIEQFPYGRRSREKL